MNMPLAQEAPLALRGLYEWSKERFPLASGIAFSIPYALTVFYAQALLGQGPLMMGWSELGSFPAVWALFLMLRVFDEHKDYDIDCKNHPQRVLQRGLVTLGQLKVVAVLAIVVQLGTCLVRDGGFGRILTLWLLTFAWSLLMAWEFFLGEWLVKRVVLYAGLHVALMPIAHAWMGQLGVGEAPLSLHYLWVCAVSFFVAAAFELARKCKAPEDERPGVDSYTKTIGVRGAPALTLALTLIALAIDARLLLGVSGRMPWLGLVSLGLGGLACAAGCYAFMRAPSAKNAKKLEAGVATALMGGYLAIAITLIARRGLQWH